MPDPRATKVTREQWDHRGCRDFGDYRVLKGDTGDMGPQGPQGLQGIAGARG